ncbi:MAG: ABC-type transport auxiliary lipoprotein family protein [Thermodesulfovibrionales bacterium]
MRVFVVSVLSAVVLLSCSMSNTRIYNLSLPSMKEMPHVGAVASVNVLLHAPRYLDQPYIAYRISPYELKLSNASRWDSSPADIVKGAIKDSLSFSGFFAAVTTSAVTPPGFYRCEVSLRRFERFDKINDSFGELDLEIIFLSPEGRILYSGTLSKEAKLDDRSFLSLATFLSEALSQGLDEASAAIIKSLP